MLQFHRNPWRLTRLLTTWPDALLCLIHIIISIGYIHTKIINSYKRKKCWKFIFLWLLSCWMLPSFLHFLPLNIRYSILAKMEKIYHQGWKKIQLKYVSKNFVGWQIFATIWNWKLKLERRFLNQDWKVNKSKYILAKRYVQNISDYELSESLYRKQSMKRDQDHIFLR